VHARCAVNWDVWRKTRGWHSTCVLSAFKKSVPVLRQGRYPCAEIPLRRIPQYCDRSARLWNAGHFYIRTWRVREILEGEVLTESMTAEGVAEAIRHMSYREQPLSKVVQCYEVSKIVSRYEQELLASTSL
jgi:hypothetical protein